MFEYVSENVPLPKLTNATINLTISKAFGFYVSNFVFDFFFIHAVAVGVAVVAVRQLIKYKLKYRMVIHILDDSCTASQANEPAAYERGAIIIFGCIIIVYIILFYLDFIFVFFVHCEIYWSAQIPLIGLRDISTRK